jgi:hypothetical protein
MGDQRYPICHKQGGFAAMRTPRDEIKRLILALYNDNPGERSNAADAFYRTCLRLGIHPAEIDISVYDTLVNDQAAVIRYLKRELERVSRELAYFRRHADPEMIKNGAKSGEITFRWFEMEDLVRERISSTDEEDDLHRGWKTQLMDLLDVSAATINRWRDGTEQIPETCIERLRELPIAKAPVPKVKPRLKSSVKAYTPKPRSKTGTIFEQIKNAGKEGTTIGEIACRLGGSMAEERSASARLAELQRAMRIFKIGKHPGSHGQTIWAAAAFKDHYPAEWEVATNTYGQDEAV